MGGTGRQSWSLVHVPTARGSSTRDEPFQEQWDDSDASDEDDDATWNGVQGNELRKRILLVAEPILRSQLANSSESSNASTQDEDGDDGRYCLTSQCAALYAAPQTHGVPTVAFMGDTGVGKSRLLAQFIPDEDFKRGIRPAMHRPRVSEGGESSDVIIFEGENFLDSEGPPQGPYSYLLDVEGADSVRPGRRAWKNVKALASFCKKPLAYLCDALTGRDTADAVEIRRIRRDIVNELLPALVYNFADVVVYVTKEELFQESIHQRIHKFARRASVAPSMPRKPVLVVVQNNKGLPMAGAQQDTAESLTERFLKCHAALRNVGDDASQPDPSDWRGDFYSCFFADVIVVRVDSHVILRAGPSGRTEMVPIGPHERLADVSMLREALQKAVRTVFHREHVLRLSISAKKMFDFVEVLSTQMRLATKERVNISAAVREAMGRCSGPGVAASFALFDTLMTHADSSDSRARVQAFFVAQLLAARLLLSVLRSDDGALYDQQQMAEGWREGVVGLINHFLTTTDESKPCGTHKRMLCFDGCCLIERIGHVRWHRAPANILNVQWWPGNFTDLPLSLEEVRALTSVCIGDEFVVPAAVGAKQCAYTSLRSVPGLVEWLADKWSEVTNTKVWDVVKNATERKSPSDAVLDLQYSEAVAIAEAYRASSSRLQLFSRARRTDTLSKGDPFARLMMCLMCGRIASRSGVALTGVGSCIHKLCTACCARLSSAGQACPVCRTPTFPRSPATMGMRRQAEALALPHVPPRILDIADDGEQTLASAVAIAKLIDSVQHVLQLETPLRVCELFDLIGGAGMGGVLALAYGHGLDSRECVAIAEQVLRGAFCNRSRLAMALTSRSTRTAKLVQALGRFAALPSDMSPGSAPHVFVTAMEDSPTPRECLLTNYPVKGDRGDQSAEAYVARTIGRSTLSAAQATVSAKSTFEPVEIGPHCYNASGDMRRPSNYALAEVAHLWPTRLGVTKVTSDGPLPLRTEPTSPPVATIHPVFTKFVAGHVSVSAGRGDDDEVHAAYANDDAGSGTRHAAINVRADEPRERAAGPGVVDLHRHRTAAEAHMAYKEQHWHAPTAVVIAGLLFADVLVTVPSECTKPTVIVRIRSRLEEVAAALRQRLGDEKAHLALRLYRRSTMPATVIGESLKLSTTGVAGDVVAQHACEVDTASVTFDAVLAFRIDNPERSTVRVPISGCPMNVRLACAVEEDKNGRRRRAPSTHSRSESSLGTTSIVP